MGTQRIMPATSQTAFSRMLKKSPSVVLASLDGHFEHPVWLFGVFSHIEIRDGVRSPREFFRSLLEKQPKQPGFNKHLKRGLDRSEGGVR